MHDFADDATYGRVADAIDGKRLPVFYLEVPPSLFGTVVRGLAGAGVTENARVVVEKPFGHDLESARALNDELHALTLNVYGDGTVLLDTLDIIVLVPGVDVP